MTLSKILPLSLVLTFAGAIGCGGDDSGDTNTDGQTGSGGAGVAGAAGNASMAGAGPGAGGATQMGCNTDFAAIAAANSAPVSFSTEVMPIFRLSCNASSCHGDTRRPQAGLFTGPSTSMADPTAADLATIHTNLLSPSLTVPAVNRVTPSDPGNSFLVRKITGTHDSQGYTCTPQAPMVPQCGDPMPPLGDSLCDQTGGQDRVNTIVRWIAQGAPNN